MKTTRPPFLVLLSCCMAGLASAQTWNGANGNNWSTASSWAGGVLPSSGTGNETRVINGNIEITTAAETATLYTGGYPTLGRGVATLTIKDGGSLSTGTSYLGSTNGTPPGNGTLNVEGTGTWTMRSGLQTYIGMLAVGAVNVTGGGTVISSGGVHLGYNNSVENTANLRISGQGSTWTIAPGGSLAIGMQGGNGILTLDDGGTLRTTQNFTSLSIGGSNGTGTLNIGTGGAAGYVDLYSVSTYTTGTGKLNFNHNESNYVFSTPIDRAITVEQKGTGTTSITGANTYTGNTIVSGGELKANNTTGSAFGTGNVQVNASTTLSGTGRFTGSAVIDGTYAPGNSVGNLTSGSITIGATGEYEWEINKADGTAGQASGGWDHATVNGTLTFQEGATLSIVSLGLDNLAGLATAFDQSQNYLWTIAAATGGIIGAEDVTIDTTGFQNSYTGTFGLTTSGNNLQLRYTAGVIPEPSSLLLTAGVIVTFAGRRRRK